MTPEEVRTLLLRDRSERSKQRAVGPSEIGGCRRKVWHRTQGTPITNPDTYTLASSMGTWIHAGIEGKLAGSERYLLETTLERDSIRGHVDCFDVERNMVIDWKSIKLSGIPYFPKKQQRWQVQIYGWLMSEQRLVESVCLVGLPRDGTDADIITHVEPYSERMALEALEWLREVQTRTDPPKPEMRKKFCRHYCGYYDPTGVVGCPSM